MFKSFIKAADELLTEDPAKVLPVDSESGILNKINEIKQKPSTEQKAAIVNLVDDINANDKLSNKVKQKLTGIIKTFEKNIETAEKQSKEDKDSISDKINEKNAEIDKLVKEKDELTKELGTVEMNFNNELSGFLNTVEDQIKKNLPG